MARSNIDSHGLLDAWARVMHEDAFRFNQFYGDGVTRLPGCDTHVYIQYERDYIASALRQAVDHAAQHLQFYPLPIWLSETLTLQPDRAWDEQTLTPRFGYVQGFGNRATQLISEGATVTYSDTNSDGVEDKASLTVDSIFSPEQTRVFFRVADGAPAAAHKLYEITDLEIVDNADGTYTITGHKAQFAKPSSVWTKEFTDSGFSTRAAADTETAGNYVTTVDVYRVYPDDSLQSDGSAAVQLVAKGGKTPVKALLLDNDSGSFQLCKLDSEDADPPDSVSVEINTLAGWPLENRRMSPTFESVIVRYANTLFPQQPSSFCDRVKAMWENDLSLLETELRDTENKLLYPFTLASTDLWATIRSFRLTEQKVTQRKTTILAV